MNFIKQLLSTFVSIFICIVILPIVALITLLVFAISHVGTQHENLGNINNDIVYYDLSTPIFETPQTEGGTIKFFVDKMPSLSPAMSTYDICQAITNIGENPLHKVLFIHGKLPPEITLAQVEEIRNSILKLSKTKQVIAYLENPTQLEYFLTSASSAIVLNPVSDFTLKGMSSSPMFLGDAFKKYGIQAQVIKSGKHKNFANIFTENKLDETDKQHLFELIDNIWQNVLSSISASRKIQLDKLKDIATKKPIMTAQEALSYGFVNKLAYADEMIETLSKICGQDSKTFNKREKLNITTLKPYPTRKENLALVYMTGDIVEMGERDTISADKYVPLLREIRENDEIKAVVVRIDSGGGSAYASEQIRRELSLLSKRKPVVVSMGSMCASGGFWIATAASKTFADETTITGSIGVVSVIFSAEKLANDFGVTFDNVKTSPFADIFNSTRETSPEAIAKIKPLLDDTFNKFVKLVSSSRKMSEQDALSLADGRVYTGVQANKLNLCDEIGNLENAIAVAKKMANLDEISIKQFPETDIIEDFFAKFENIGIFSKNGNTKIIKDAKKLIKTFDSKNTLQAKVPFVLNLKY